MREANHVRYAVKFVASGADAGPLILEDCGAGMSRPARRTQRGRTMNSRTKKAMAGVLLVTGVATMTACEIDEGNGKTAGEKAAAEVKKDKPESDFTVAQENAIDSAQSYLDMSGFSHDGLVEQLSSKYGDGYSVKDATVAVDALDVDWNAEAVQSAKSYLDMSGFSRAGLIQQLSSPSGDQFTKAQATYAADKVGL